MYLAVDIGGTKTFVASINEAGDITERFRFPTSKDYTTFIDDLAKSVDKLSTKTFVACGVGAPGKIDRSSGIGQSMGNLPWVQAPIADDISKLANCPVVVDNDANLAGLSEAKLLSDGARIVLYVTIGTGIGTAVVIDGKLALPDSEGGHMLVEHDGKLQKWEAFASGRAIMQRYGKPAAEITDPEAWKYIAHVLTVGLIDLIAFAQPDAIIFGGGVSKHYLRLQQPLMSELEKYETPLVPIPPIYQAQRPEEAVLFGCYELAKMPHGTPTRTA